MKNDVLIEKLEEVIDKIENGEVASVFVVYVGADNQPHYTNEGAHDVLTLIGAISTCLRDLESQEFDFD
jgi:hypothetical protein